MKPWSCARCRGLRRWWLAVWVSGWVVHFGFAHAAAPARPNVVLILVDDLGWNDLGVTGSEFYETPHIDRLARAGMRFTQAYAACTVCSPTRAALLTGKYPARLHLTDWIKGHDYPKAKLRPPAWTMQLPLEEVTLAEHLKAAGYATAHIGKWHLGGAGFEPERQGFDVNLGGDHRGQPPSYFAPYGLPRLTDGPAGEYLTDREGAEAARFIAANKDRPFFLNLWFYAVHTPLQAKADLVAKYRRKAAALGGAQTNAVYAAMIESLDAAVGHVLQALEEAGVAAHTLVLFTSDNGGLVLGRPPVTSNAPLRAGKGSSYEGGVRVPLVIRWPGVTRAGSESDQPVITMDLCATVLEATGAAPAGGAPDGLSLLPLLRDPGTRLHRTALFWHYPHYHPGGATPYAAIRDGDWKLVQHFETGRNELFHLREDPGEANDLAAQHPDRVMELARRLFDWQNALRAQWPVYNPDHEPAPIAPDADGSVLLHARDAAVHGTTVRYEPQPFKNTIGYWTRAEDWVSWDFEVAAPGEFRVEVLQGCGAGSGGAEVDFTVGAQTLRMTVQETGHFQNFVAREIGTFRFDRPGRHTLEVKPRTKPGVAVMDLRQVRLVPAAR